MPVLLSEVPYIKHAIYYTLVSIVVMVLSDKQWLKFYLVSLSLAVLVLLVYEAYCLLNPPIYHYCVYNYCTLYEREKICNNTNTSGMSLLSHHMFISILYHEPVTEYRKSPYMWYSCGYIYSFHIYTQLSIHAMNRLVQRGCHCPVREVLPSVSMTHGGRRRMSTTSTEAAVTL